MAFSDQQHEEWYEQPLRWGQVNLKEDDPLTLDVDFWVAYWQRTQIQGVTLNAGGGVAYYPTLVPFHRRARFLGHRDLFGELVRAAKGLGLRVLARLDPNFGHVELYEEHPDWFLTDAEGRPRQRGQAAPMAQQPQFGSAQRDVLYSTCWNGPFHHEFMLSVMTEIMQRYDVDGFFTNGWPPIGAMPPDLSMVCYCPHCRERWVAQGYTQLPTAMDASDPLWRAFVRFVQGSVEEVQGLWQIHTKKLKPSATFVWNSHGSLATGLRWDEFIPLGDLLDNDTQGRRVGTPLWEAGRSGKLMAAVSAGKPVFHLFGTWQVGDPPMRHTAKPAAEETLWIAEGVAHGQRPWFHTLGGTPEDRRWMEGVAAYYDWHARAERYLRNTGSLADVGIIWSPRTFWLERWDAEAFGGLSAQDAFNGWYLALLEARQPFDLVPEWTLQTADLSCYRVLIVPSVTCLDAGSAQALARYVAAGGGLIASYEASLRNLWGTAGKGYSLGPTLGVQRWFDPPAPLTHCYLRLGMGEIKHPLFTGVGETDILPGARWLSRVRALPGTATLGTLVPTYPTAPPEKVYMDPAQTDEPLLFLRERTPANGRTLYLAMDFDAAYWRSRLPDHARLLANAVHWVRSPHKPPVEVEGRGLLDVMIWRQAHSCTVHLVNLSNPNLYGGNVTEHLPLVDQYVRLRPPAGTRVLELHLLRNNLVPPLEFDEDGCVRLLIERIVDFEVIAIDLGPSALSGPA